MNIIYKSPFDNQCKVVSAKTKKISIEELKQLILCKEDLFNVNIDFNIIFNGKKITDNLFIDNFNIFIQISLPLNGGKGGFGSMLRALGAQIEKTTNREACRDLSGRRLRDIKEEKRLKEWIKKQADRKEEEIKRKEKLKRIAEGKLTANCEYDDTEFEKFRNEIPDIVEDSINQGLQQDSKNKTGDLKRKTMENDNSHSSSVSTDEDINKPSCSKTIPTSTTTTTTASSSSNNNSNNKKIKKHNLWLGVDADSDSDSDSDIEQKEKKEEKQSKALKN